MIHREDVQRVLRAMDQLSESHREVISLRFLSDYSNDELAEYLQISTHHDHTTTTRLVLIRPNVAGFNLSRGA